jgi:hypothetical protein
VEESDLVAPTYGPHRRETRAGLVSANAAFPAFQEESSALPGTITATLLNVVRTKRFGSSSGQLAMAG